MSDEQAPRSDVRRAKRQKAQALAVAGLAVVGSSYIALVLLLPLVAMVVIVAWLVYGGGAAFLVLAVLVALSALVIYTLGTGLRR